MSLELEKAVLTCIFMDDKLEVIDLSKLNIGLFPHMAHWYNPIIEYRKSGKPADILIANDILGTEITKELCGFQGSLACYDDYLYKLKRKSFLTNLGTKLQGQTIGIQDFEEGIKILSPKNKHLQIYDQNTNLSDYTDELDNRIIGNINWYDWGVDFLDKHIGKLRMGKLIVLKGRRKFGKTTFAIMILNSFLQRDLPVIFISTEMGHFQILDKLLALNTQLNSFDILMGKIEEDMSKIIKTVKDKLAYKKNKIVLCTQLNIKNIEELITQHKPKIIIIDYLQMLSIDNIPSGMNHSQVMGNMAVKLKNLCLENNLSILALSQVNEAGDTKNCKSFEETADTILWLNEKEKGIESLITKEMVLDITNRDGNSVIINLLYFKTYGAFDEETKEEEKENYTNTD